MPVDLFLGWHVLAREVLGLLDLFLLFALGPRGLMVSSISRGNAIATYAFDSAFRTSLLSWEDLVTWTYGYLDYGACL